MSYPPTASGNDGRPVSSYGSPYYARPPGSSHGIAQTAGQTHGSSSPERLHSSHGFAHKPPPSPSHHVGGPIYANSNGDPNALNAPPGSSHGYPTQPPLTPISGSAGGPNANYHSQGPALHPPGSAGGLPPSTGASNGQQYYGMPGSQQSQHDPMHMPSPPPTSNGHSDPGAVPAPPGQGKFTTDGNPIVPVGISGGKMFQCRGYGDCDKVFTRSEHLARHVRKHTGERPFPCHCGKAFSRLDNLRQHAATVHADQAGLNDAMLNSLAPVHAALSQRANREQRKRGEVVEVPKNAVERPRHNEGFRNQRLSPGSLGPTIAAYPPYDNNGWDQHGRPRTGGGYYPFAGNEGEHPVDGSGPSRRPGSPGFAGGYPPYYDGQPRPPTAPGTGSSGGGGGGADSLSQLPYPYRPMSSNGRELPVPAHYAESEPPSTSHGPPQSPMYPPGVAPPAWSSPPPPPHSSAGYASHDAMYPPPPESYPYPGEHQPHGGHGYGPAPPSSAGSNYNYQSGYYPPSTGYGGVGPAPGGPYPPPAGGSSYAAGGPAPPPPESPFQYHAPPGGDSYAYPGGNGYDRKRRAEDDGNDHAARKMQRPLSNAPPTPQSVSQAHRQPLGEPQPPAGNGAGGNNGQQDSLWLPPASERRSSLAISALLGSPQQAPRSRPTTADVPPQPLAAYGQSGENGTYPYPGTNGSAQGTGPDRDDSKQEGNGVINMEEKARALLGAGAAR